MNVDKAMGWVRYNRQNKIKKKVVVVNSMCRVGQSTPAACSSKDTSPDRNGRPAGLAAKAARNGKSLLHVDVDSHAILGILNPWSSGARDSCVTPSVSSSALLSIHEIANKYK